MSTIGDWSDNSVGYCPRCGENSSFGSGPNNVVERRQPLRVPAKSNIVSLPEGDTIRYAGMRFQVTHDGNDRLLWAIE
jgi:hypothetical protein